MNPRVAVIGAGIFGCTAAIHLARAGFRVGLFERKSEILQCASATNQYRLHRGYHYPRSYSTAVSCMKAEQSFIDEFPDAVLDDVPHYYGIATSESLVSGDQYLAFLDRVGLNYQIVRPEFANLNNLELVIVAHERRIDIPRLRELLRQKLNASGVDVLRGVEVKSEDLRAYDFCVVATYAHINALVDNYPGAIREYQFELCEKPVVRVPKPLDRLSMVVMDGPFCSVDPYGRSGMSVLGHVRHAIWESNVGQSPRVPPEFASLLDGGIIERPARTRVDDFLTSFEAFVPALRAAEHVGSMFTVRTVLPNVDDTDARPTLVHRVGDTVVTIFSGKISTCVRAAEEVVAIATQIFAAAPPHQRRSFRLSVPVATIIKFDDGTSLATVTYDISATGFRAPIARSLEPGSRVDITFELPFNDAVVSIVADVRWVRSIGSVMNEVAFVFRELPLDSGAFAKFLSSFMVSEI